MACILWMPAAQGMPDYALAIGRSFSLQFILLSSNCNRMSKKSSRRKHCLWEGWETGLLWTAPWLQQLGSKWAGKINVTWGLNSELELALEESQLQHSCNCLGDSVVTRNWRTTGRLCSKSTQVCKAWWRNKSSTCFFQICPKLVPAGDLLLPAVSPFSAWNNTFKSLSGF